MVRLGEMWNFEEKVLSENGKRKRGKEWKETARTRCGICNL